MISLPTTESLLPREVSLGNGRVLHVFGSNTELVKLDFLHEAGSLYQQQLLCAAAANKLMTVATENMVADVLSEFMDFRGVILEPNNTLTHSTITVYMLRRYADEVLPVVAEMLQRPAFAEEDFRLWQANRRQELATLEQRTSHIARRLFYKSLFGVHHPLGWYATVEDVDKLSIEAIRRHYNNYYSNGPCAIVASGKVDNGLEDLLARHFSIISAPEARGVDVSEVKVGDRCETKMDGAVQASLRIGRLLPLRWNDPDYARLMLLVTALGGYFGSRLMSNLREDKGYTYGTYARTQIYRGAILFYITADVAGGTADAAVEEVCSELKRLCNEPLDKEELQLVKMVFIGDFLRSVDGVFELSSRYCDMLGTSITEQLTDNIRTAINETTAEQLQVLAQRCLCVNDMTVCIAGAM